MDRQDSFEQLLDDSERSRGERPDDADLATAPGSASLAKLGLTGITLATAACGPEDMAANTGRTTAELDLERAALDSGISDAEAARFVLHASLSCSMGDIRQVQSIGKRAWLNRQMRAEFTDSARKFFADRGYDRIDDGRHYMHAVLADNMVWSQLLSSEEPVRKRVAFALSEFFVVSPSNFVSGWKACAIGEYWDLLNAHAFGNFRELLEEITLNPAMGMYLNMRRNKKADPVTGRVPDENFAREIMQLFSIGLYELEIDGTARLDASGNPIETYTNEDITGIAKCFTGYDCDFTGQQLVGLDHNPDRTIVTVDFYRQPMTPDPSKWREPQAESFHSLEEKAFLGTVIPAGTGPEETLRLTLDAVFNHPNVGPFFGKQMIQRLVTSNPSPAYVQRVAEVFNDNGRGVRGDLRSVFRAILLDDEANSAETLADPTFGKLREPALRFVQWGRTFNVASDSGAWDVRDLSDDRLLGQSPLRSPSVFNFFRPGYQPPATQAARRGLLAPEFQIVNEASVANYVNFIHRTVVDMSTAADAPWMRDITANYGAMLKYAHRAKFLLNRFDLLLTGQQLSRNTRELILAAMEEVDVNEDSPQDKKLERIHVGLILTLVSTDYLVQR